MDQPLDFYGFEFPRHPNRRITFSILDPEHAPPGASIDSTGTRLVWEVPKDDYISSRPWDWGNVRTHVGKAFQTGGTEYKLMALDDPDLEPLWARIGSI